LQIILISMIGVRANYLLLEQIDDVR
jgi:hypothetical protein